ncbi:MAG: quinol:electron acceptor oxidoreductase subunit ActD [Bacteroidota bacterium]
MANKLYAVTATFSSPNDIIAAAKGVNKAGYTKYDVHTPYPVHGMDKAMSLPETKLGFTTLAAGIMGAVGMISFTSWVASVDYPQVIGGKPYWSWPAFVPVTYEIAVLLAVLMTVGAMIAFFFKFPNISHPLHDTPYMKKVSADKYGVAIQAEDPKFNEQEVKDLLKSLHGEVENVYYTDEFMNFTPRMFEPRFILLLIGVAIVSAGGGYVTWNKLMYLPPFDWMMEQTKVKPQSVSEFYADGFGMRLPAEGTVARGMTPYPFTITDKTDSVGALLANPLLPTPEVLAMGKKKYLTFCSPCHGNFGAGDSRLQGQFPNPPTLHSDKVRQWPDGSMYHVISVGQNVMPAYQYQVTREERWAIVHYVRTLQRALNAKESDLQ